MKNINKIIFFTALVFLMSCASEERQVEEIRNSNSVTDIIRNPITADGIEDTVNVAKMEFENKTINFGEAMEGDTVSQSFKFKNTGKIPLLINSARAVCGCTVPKYPKESIAPGDEGTIEVLFSTRGRINDQNRDITIIANTFPKENIITLAGHVIPAGSDSN